MFTELKESIVKEIKEGMMTMLHQIENVNKKVENYQKEPSGNSGVEKYNK